MIWFAGLIGLVIVAVLLGSLAHHSLLQSRQRRTPARPAAGQRFGSTPGARTCPICRSALGNGRRIYSAVFPGASDRLMHIFGCPECFPKHQPIEHPQERRCPVCTKELSLDDFLIARMFPPRPGKPKPHVHVLGCTRCRRGPR